MCLVFSPFSNAVKNPYFLPLRVHILGIWDSVTSVSFELVSGRLMPSESPESKWWVCCYGNLVMKLHSCPHPLCWNHKWSLMENVSVWRKVGLQLTAILKSFVVSKHHNRSVSFLLQDNCISVCPKHIKTKRELVRGRLPPRPIVLLWYANL